jgi:hypothetical protein
MGDRHRIAAEDVLQAGLSLSIQRFFTIVAADSAPVNHTKLL